MDLEKAFDSLDNDIENISGFFVTIDLEIVFYSLNHEFLLCILKKNGFGDNFISWIKILNDHQSCVYIGRVYYSVYSGDPISAYLFVIAL